MEKSLEEDEINNFFLTIKNYFFNNYDELEKYEKYYDILLKNIKKISKILSYKKLENTNDFYLKLKKEVMILENILFNEDFKAILKKSSNKTDKNYSTDTIMKEKSQIFIMKIEIFYGLLCLLNKLLFFIEENLSDIIEFSFTCFLKISNFSYNYQKCFFLESFLELLFINKFKIKEKKNYSKMFYKCLKYIFCLAIKKYDENNEILEFCEIFLIELLIDKKINENCLKFILLINFLKVIENYSCEEYKNKLMKIIDNLNIKNSYYFQFLINKKFLEEKPEKSEILNKEFLFKIFNKSFFIHEPEVSFINLKYDKELYERLYYEIFYPELLNQCQLIEECENSSYIQIDSVNSLIKNCGILSFYFNLDNDNLLLNVLLKLNSSLFEKSLFEIFFQSNETIVYLIEKNTKNLNIEMLLKIYIPLIQLQKNFINYGQDYRFLKLISNCLKLISYCDFPEDEKISENVFKFFIIYKMKKK